MPDPTPTSEPFFLPPQPDSGRFAARLPHAPTSFVGREADVVAVAGLLGEGVRLVTLTGPGGVGKTRLAVRVAEAVAATFADGVHFVDLSAVDEADLVLPAVSQALGLHEGGDRSAAEHLATWLAPRRFLLVLDNLEQVVDAAPQIAGLLGHCPGLAILATSRVVLRVTAEHVVPVVPLPVPDDSPSLRMDELVGSEAVSLFVERARAADSSFALTPENGASVAAIVRRLDGLPLAIELAAARTRHLAPAALFERLIGRLGVLADGPRDSPARHRTAIAAVAWSDNLLGEGGRALFHSLAIFQGGMTHTAAAAVRGDDERRVLDGMFALVDHSLLLRVDPPGTGAGGGAEPRFRMLETVRSYALERLTASGRLDATSRAHAAWCLEFAEAHAPALVGPASLGAEAASVLDRFTAEHDNLRAGLAWSLQHGETELVLRLINAMREFWLARGHLREGLGWCERTRDLLGGARPADRGWAQFTAAELLAALGNPAAARPFIEKAYAIGQGIGDSQLEGRSTLILGAIAWELDELDVAEGWFERGLALGRSLGNANWEQGMLVNLALLAEVKGDLTRATAMYESALPIAQALDDGELILITTLNLGHVLGLHGQIRRAATLTRDALTRARVTALPSLITVLLEDVVVLASDSGQAAGARLLGAAAALRKATDLPTPRRNQPEVDRAVDRYREALGEQAFTTAWQEGAACSVDQALAEADDLLSTLAETSDPAPSTGAGGLSPRELDVVRLLAAGKSNRDIADALFISHSTAITHVRNILGKLGLDSRTAVAAWAVRNNLD